MGLSGPLIILIYLFIFSCFLFIWSLEKITKVFRSFASQPIEFWISKCSGLARRCLRSLPVLRPGEFPIFASHLAARRVGVAGVSGAAALLLDSFEARLGVFAQGSSPLGQPGRQDVGFAPKMWEVRVKAFEIWGSAWVSRQPPCIAVNFFGGTC